MGLSTRSATLLILLITVMLSLALLSTPTAAQGAPLTEANGFISTSKQTNSNKRHFRTGAKCIEYTFVTRKAGWGLKYKFRRLFPWYYTNEKAVDSCATKTKYGIFGTANGKTYIQLNGQALAGEVVNHSFRSRVALPNSSSLLVSSDNLKTLYKVSNVAETISATATIDRRLKYTLAPPGPKVVCTNKNACRLDTIGHFESSSNGNQIVAHIPNFGMTSINIETLEYQTFGRPSVYVRTGAPPYRQIAVSSSGSYAAVYYSDIKKLYTYDLTDCKPNPKDPTKPDICTSNDITGYLGDEGIDITSLRGLSFASDSNLYLFTKGLETGKTNKTEITSSEGKLIGEISYIALGDSFASGEGDLDASWYEIGTDESENKCHLSRRSYPYLLAQNLDFDESHSVACSGAVIGNVIGGIDEPKQHESAPTNNILADWLPGLLKQEDYLNKVIPRTTTISIGGNDVAFADKLRECVLGAGTCKYAEGWLGRSGTAIEIANLKPKLVETYEQLISTTESNTKVYAVGYPKFINADLDANCGLNVLLNSAEREFVEQGVLYMNQIISSAAKEAGIYYLDVEDSLAGRNLCSGAPNYLTAVNGLTNGNDNLGIIGTESYHPNPIGHELIYESIQQLTDDNLVTFEICADSKLICPETNDIPLPDAAYWGPEAALYVEDQNSPSSAAPSFRVPEKKSLTELVTERGEQIDINVSDLKPNSVVSVEIQSTPTPLGEFTVGNIGILEASISIPKEITPGLHTIHIFGEDIFGDPVDYYQHIYITGSAEDIDGDGILNANDPCLYVDASGVDYDEDGIDDACDGFIAQKPTDATVVNEETSSAAEVEIIQSNPIAVSLASVAANNPVVYEVNGSQNTSNLERVLGAEQIIDETGGANSQENVKNFASESNFSNPDNLVIKVVVFIVGLVVISFVWLGIKKFHYSNH